MKSIKKIIILLLIAVMVMMTLTGCNSNKEDENNKVENKKEGESIIEVSNTIEQQLDKYLGRADIISNKEVEEYCNPAMYKLIDNEVNGVISGKIIDINNKENKKALIVEKKDNTLVLKLFDKGENELQKIDELKIANVMDMDSIKINGFTKYVNNKDYKIFIEVFEGAGLFSDGVTYKFIPIIVNDDKMVEQESCEINGSLIDEEEEFRYLSFVREQGADIANISRTAFEDTDEIVKLFNVTRKHIPYFDSAELYGSKEEKVKYGTTKYGNYDENVKEETVSSKDLYMKVLNNELDFINENNEKISFDKHVKDYKVSGYELKFRYAILDMDNDEDDEIVVEISGFDTMYLILNNDDGTIYGYEQPSRGLMGLKTDGSYTASGGASVFAICKSTFIGTTMRANELASMDGDEYKVSGRTTTLAELKKYQEMHDSIPDAEFVEYK